MGTGVQTQAHEEEPAQKEERLATRIAVTKRAIANFEHALATIADYTGITEEWRTIFADAYEGQLATLRDELAELEAGHDAR